VLNFEEVIMKLVRISPTIEELGRKYIQTFIEDIEDVQCQLERIIKDYRM